MITLYRTKVCPFCDEIEEHLRTLVVAHRVIIVEEREEGAHPSLKQLPMLKEGNAVYGTAGEIKQFLYDLALEVRINRTYQSDACFVDPEDGRACL